MTRTVRAVLHAHSTWSYDGHWSLAKIARLFGAMGARAVMMTEHDTGFSPDRYDEYRAACAQASTRLCRIVPGIEYSCPDNDVHILTWGLDRFLSEHHPVMETLEAVRSSNGVAVFAHPVRRNAYDLFDPAWVPYLSAIELWNRKSDGLTIGREARDLIRDTGLPATVGIDFHRMRHVYPLFNRVSVAGDLPLETALVAGLRDGAIVPEALYESLLAPDGQPRTGVHDRLERARRNGIRLLRRS